MRKVKALETWEQIKLLGDDTKLAILERSLRPTTVSRLAEGLEVPRTRLYHHVKVLVQADLLRVVRRRPKGPVIESEYQVTASTFRPSRALLASLGPAEIGAALMAIIFGPAKAEFVAALDNGAFALTDTGNRRKVQLARHLMHLTPDELDNLIKEVEALYEKYDPAPGRIREGTIPVAAVSLIHPRRRSR